MAQQRKGFVARMLEGKEKSEEYARSTLPTNRWQLFWDIFKGNFGKIVKVNLLIALFFVPLLLVVFITNVSDQSNGIIYPFGANLSLGYPAVPNLSGLSESVRMQSNLVRFGGIAISTLIASVGLSGGMYVIRNMVWTEGIFVANDFWRGVKLNYKNALQASLFFSIVLLLCNSLIDLTDFTLAIGTIGKGKRTWLLISKAVSVALIVLSCFMTYWMIALGVNYNHKFFQLVKNSFLMTVGMLPQTVFFIALSMIPFLLFALGSSFVVIALIVVFLFAFSYLLLVWLDFAQWAFDRFINPKIEGAKVGRGIYNKDGSSAVSENESAAAKEYNRVILAAGKSQLVSRPIKPLDDSMQVYELPSSFTRDDLKRLKESKQSIVEDTKAYEEEHKNDLRYVEYNKRFEEREKALQDAENGKKKRKPPKMLGQ